MEWPYGPVKLPGFVLSVLGTTGLKAGGQVSLQYRLIPQNISSLYSEFNQNYEQVAVWGRTSGRIQRGPLAENVQTTPEDDAGDD